MDCNMYVYVEKFIAGQWRYITPPDYAPYSFYVGKRSVVYAQLAGVRNSESLTPIVDLEWRRGLPSDVTDQVRRFKLDDQLKTPDNRITTWATLAELEQIDWEAFSAKWDEYNFSHETMDRLRNVAMGRPENVRIVFW